MKWLIESNRWKHLVGIAMVAFATIVAMYVLFGYLGWQHYVIATYVSLAVSAAMEFKDVHHDNGDVSIFEWEWDAWDWLDIAAGMIGCAIMVLLVVVIDMLT